MHLPQSSFPLTPSTPSPSPPLLPSLDFPPFKLSPALHLSIEQITHVISLHMANSSSFILSQYPNLHSSYLFTVYLFYHFQSPPLPPHLPLPLAYTRHTIKGYTMDSPLRCTRHILSYAITARVQRLPSICSAILSRNRCERHSVFFCLGRVTCWCSEDVERADIFSGTTNHV